MKSGEVFIVTSGEYSDYGIRGMFRALKDFSWNDEVRAFTSEHPDPYEGGGHQEFLQSLVDRGLAEEHSIKTVHIGDYSRFELEAEEPVPYTGPGVAPVGGAMTDEELAHWAILEKNAAK